MKTWIRLIGALLLLVVPSVMRHGAFYQGTYTPVSAPEPPDYAAMDFALPALATPEVAFAVDGAGKVVVLDNVHGNQFELDEVQVLLDLFNAAGSQVLTVDNAYMPLAPVLKYADVYITIAPTLPFDAGDVTLLARFVDRGGRLLVITDPTRNGYEASLFDLEDAPLDADVRAANPLLQPFGMAFASDYVYNIVENEANYRNVKFSDFSDSPLTRGLSDVVLYAAHSVNALSGTPLLWGGEAVFSSRTDAGGRLAPAALSANGQVLALGDVTFMTAPYHQVADNGLFIARIAEFLLDGERTYTLDDYPYLFQQPVIILPLIPDFTLTADMLDNFGALQSGLGDLGMMAHLGTEPLSGSDLVILATYDFDEQALPYLAPFGFEVAATDLEDADTGGDAAPAVNDTAPLSATTPLTSSYASLWWDEPEPTPDLTPTPAPIHIPGVGHLAREETGVLIYTHTEERATLIMLADSTEALGRLLLTLRDEALAPCVTQPQMALCRIPLGDADVLAEDDDGADDFFDWGYDEAPAYPDPIETPAPFPLFPDEPEPLPVP